VCVCVCAPTSTHIRTVMPRGAAGPAAYVPTDQPINS